MSDFASTKPAILVIGDSFVDENWLASPFDVYHAYNVGRDHYVSNLRQTDVRILSLCGAASVWRMLYGATTGGPADPAHALRSSYQLLGVSAWNPLDHERLLCLLCSRGNDRQCANPYLLSGLLAPDGSGSCPYDDQPCTSPPQFLNLITKNADAIKYTSTNRLIRVYAGFGGDQPQLEHRYDWRLDTDSKHKVPCIVEEVCTEIRGAEVAAIVVVDHGYGVVDETLIAALSTRFPRARWYVRCKLEHAPWLGVLGAANATIRLAFTDEQLMSYKYGARVWTQGPNVVGRGSLEALGDLLGLPVYRNNAEIAPANRFHADNAALLLNNDTVVAATRARIDEQNDARITCSPRSPGPQHAIRVGRSTVCFASLVYWDLLRGGLDACSFGLATAWAAENEYRWTEVCTNAWLAATPTQLSGPFERALELADPESVGTNGSFRHLYSQLWQDWNASSRDCGIVAVPGDLSQPDEKPEPQIQLWRALGTVGSYLCPGGEKRNRINELVRRFDQYQSVPNPRYPFNCLLLAEPGWGKSYLAQSLAEKFDFGYVSFSIAGMASNMDLMHALKGVSSLQNELRRPLLVFVDEVDAEIGGHSAMGLLLGPMWEGTFKTEGVAYRIKPCAWVFASTKPLTMLLGESKGRDFLARINGPVLELDCFLGSDREKLDSEKDEEKRRLIMKDIATKSQAMRTEMVYHGVNCLNKLFRPVAAIDVSVLETFYRMFPINGVRSLEVFVSRFRNVSGGRVSVSNVPRFEDYPELERHICKIEPWPTEDKGAVKLVVNAPA